jgi:ribonuclease D
LISALISAPVDHLSDAHLIRAALVDWRTTIARQAGTRPTVVLSDKAVEALVRARPATLAELAQVRDVGVAMRERHGDHLIELVVSPTLKDPTCASS